METANNKGY